MPLINQLSMEATTAAREQAYRVIYGFVVRDDWRSLRMYKNACVKEGIFTRQEAERAEIDAREQAQKRVMR